MANELTHREKVILRLVKLGKRNKEIGQDLNLSVNTVKTHIKNIFTKLEVNNRIQAFTKAEAEKII